jgi:O-methyltransferase
LKTVKIMWAKFTMLIVKLCLLVSEMLSVPISTLIILSTNQIQQSYRMTMLRKLMLGFRMYLNTRHITTGTSYRAHLVIASKIMAIAPDIPGDIVECGTWKGGSATNLSMICNIVGRKLKVYDSFEGLPDTKPEEPLADANLKGAFSGTLDEVMSNIKRYGKIECCEFEKGWFDDTLPKLNSPVLLAFIDVDLESSLHTCVRWIWPNLVDQGYLFTDEAVFLEYVALFYSEKWWRKYLNRTPPGLIGAGTGLPLGNYFVGPWGKRLEWYIKPFEEPIAVAYTQKNLTACWTYFPED